MVPNTPKSIANFEMGLT